MKPRKPKPSALDRRLQHHDRMCTIFTYHLKPEERHCSCGKLEAEKELVELRNELAALRLFLKPFLED